uniref:alpha-L-fucosidase n=1 Tax=Thermosporothrix sp. COM3 TaxID=2490863 RepID=A0A455SAT5_9CHLR|nr:hypothetical protein KTC_03180 [Thermosporothrix sp. COM3]
MIRPTPAHIAWADSEIGVIIHYDLTVFEPSYDFRKQRGYHPDPAIFQPSHLDTDQWLETAKAAGAGYAILVAKHCTGFSLWPTQAHDYSVRSSPWKNGQGDLVADFIRSCKKYDIKPGLYYSVSCNAYCGVDNPGTVLSGTPEDQQRYNEMVLQQVTELWSNYGPLFEIWFDGGVLPPHLGGPDIVPVLQKLQPQAVVFQGPPEAASLIRWAGNESGEVNYPCWSTIHPPSVDASSVENTSASGSPSGNLWSPAEADMPNRDGERAFQGGWFWKEGEDHLVLSPEHLLQCYYRTVGHNANLLLGMAIDRTGRVPEADVRQFRAFGQLVQRHFGSPLATTRGEGDCITLDLGGAHLVDRVTLMEEIREGERVRSYELEGWNGDQWLSLVTGSAIGHKKIDRFSPLTLSKLRVRCLEFSATPMLRAFSAYEALN